MVWLGNVANIANSMNMVSYLRGTMNMGVAAAATTSTNFVAALQMFTVPAAFLADSYVRRSYRDLIFAPFEILVTDQLVHAYSLLYAFLFCFASSV